MSIHWISLLDGEFASQRKGTEEQQATAEVIEVPTLSKPIGLLELRHKFGPMAGV